MKVKLFLGTLVLGLLPSITFAADQRSPVRGFPGPTEGRYVDGRQGHDDHGASFVVWSRRDHHDHWHRHGAFERRHEADHAAHALRHRGFEARVSRD